MNSIGNNNNSNEIVVIAPTCSHNSIAVKKDYLLCITCKQEFRNGELGAMRKERESKCEHKRLEHGYASNPPKSKCVDCGAFFKS